MFFFYLIKSLLPAADSRRVLRPVEYVSNIIPTWGNYKRL